MRVPVYANSFSRTRNPSGSYSIKKSPIYKETNTYPHLKEEDIKGNADGTAQLESPGFTGNPRFCGRTDSPHHMAPFMPFRKNACLVIPHLLPFFVINFMVFILFLYASFFPAWTRLAVIDTQGKNLSLRVIYSTRLPPFGI